MNRQQIFDELHGVVAEQGQRAFCGRLVKWEGLRWRGFLLRSWD